MRLTTDIDQRDLAVPTGGSVLAASGSGFDMLVQHVLDGRYGASALEPRPAILVGGSEEWCHCVSLCFCHM